MLRRKWVWNMEGNVLLLEQMYSQLHWSAYQQFLCGLRPQIYRKGDSFVNRLDC